MRWMAKAVDLIWNLWARPILSRRDMAMYAARTAFSVCLSVTVNDGYV
jgi:hypothetical protein